MTALCVENSCGASDKENAGRWVSEKLLRDGVEMQKVGFGQKVETPIACPVIVGGGWQYLTDLSCMIPKSSAWPGMLQ